MKGMMSVIITVVVVLVFGGLYWFVAKPQTDKQIQAKQKIVDDNAKKLKEMAEHKAKIDDYKALLPRWREQFDLFRAAIPTKLEDEVFLRNLNEQLRANNVQLLKVDLTPAGNWFPNLNDTQAANFNKEKMNPNEIRAVKVANFNVSLSGNYADVLRAFENLKLYGRIFAINRIISPSGGAGGAVFQNESTRTTPIEVGGKVFYGLSESYLSQGTLDTYFGQADITGAAAGISTSAMRRAEEIAANPASVPAPGAAAPAKPKPAGAAGAPAPAAGTKAPAVPGAGSASAGTGPASRLASVNKSHNRAVAVGG